MELHPFPRLDETTQGKLRNQWVHWRMCQVMRPLVFVREAPGLNAPKVAQVCHVQSCGGAWLCNSFVV